MDTAWQFKDKQTPLLMVPCWAMEDHLGYFVPLLHLTPVEYTHTRLCVELPERCDPLTPFYIQVLFVCGL